MSIQEFETFSFNAGKIKHQVFHRGQGPGVLLMHELPGMTPPCIRLAERISEAGFHVYLPLLFGQPGQRSVGRSMARICIQRQIRLLAERRTSPISDWLRALSLRILAENDGPGVGAIGMCLTGNFAIGLMADEHVLAPIASQPSLPFVVTASKKRALALAPEVLDKVRDRARQGRRLLGLRFTGDCVCPGVRFDSLRHELEDGFEAIEIDSSDGNPHGIPTSAHSVLTDDLVDDDGHPTHAALERVLEFLGENLRNV